MPVTNLAASLHKYTHARQYPLVRQSSSWRPSKNLILFVSSSLSVALRNIGVSNRPGNAVLPGIPSAPTSLANYYLSCPDIHWLFAVEYPSRKGYVNKLVILAIKIIFPFLFFSYMEPPLLSWQRLSIEYTCNTLS